MSDLNTNIGPERVQVFPKALGTVQVPGAGISNCAFLISTTLGGAPVNVATPVTANVPPTVAFPITLVVALRIFATPVVAPNIIVDAAPNAFTVVATVS